MKDQTINRMELWMEIRMEESASGVQYAVVAEEGYLPELGAYRTYGIQMTTADREEILHDVSISERVVRGIVERINRHQLSPFHFYDYVMDEIP